MAKSRPTKLTKQEIARNIEREGVLDHYKSSCLRKYYTAFGLTFRLNYSSGGTLKSIEQLDKNGNPVHFE